MYTDVYGTKGGASLTDQAATTKDEEFEREKKCHASGYIAIMKIGNRDYFRYWQLGPTFPKLEPPAQSFFPSDIQDIQRPKLGIHALTIP